MQVQEISVRNVANVLLKWNIDCHCLCEAEHYPGLTNTDSHYLPDEQSGLSMGSGILKCSIW